MKNVAWFLWIVSILGGGLSQVVYLQPGDLKRVVYRSRDAWLVSFTNQVRDLIALDEEFKGLFRVGIFDVKKYGKDASITDEPLSDGHDFVIYPYGTSDVKSKNRSPAKTIAAAKPLVLDLPDLTRNLPNKISADNEELREFFRESYATTPTRFPAVYFTDSSETPSEYKMLALKYSTLYNFGIVKKPSREMIEAYSIYKLPHFTGIVVERLKGSLPPRIRKIQFLDDTHGPLTYPFIVRFLYVIHKYHYKDLPYSGVNPSNIDLDEMFMADLQRFTGDYVKTPVKNVEKEL